MSKTFDQGKDEVVKLCQHFTTNRQAFFAPGIKEAHIRQMLIDPFFEALGWDVRSAAMVAPQYREVIPEDSLDVEGQQKAPDYTFRVGTLPKFYAEAKKCGVNIGADPGPAYQLRRYGWSAKVALSILTDFEELGVYDCTLRPRPADKASYARIQYFRFDEYPDRWRELWDVFSREAVWSGAFDQYAASKRKRGTSEVDVEFLKEIEGWRDTLARNIALRNKGLSSDDLNAAVQTTIDRVVFLRMAEDRGLEPYDQLLKLCERDDIYPRFMRDLCRRADEKYNSGLFHFQKESDVSEDPDRITPKLAVDDKVFKPILQSLYFAHGSPYHFGVLPVEILGTVYERFLGKVIRLTAGHQAKVEEKPEVRKAGGVYYTPAYIVAYIVKHTVGRQIEGKSPAQLAGGKDKPPFRVLDMACGSGSFLLGAYQCLLEYCLKWYAEHKPEAFKKAVYQDPRDRYWRLTIDEKKRILTTHILGVDIDAQAVEVTKLSLLLKVLEGETDQSVSRQQRLFHDRALPNLANNIKCGNSLIGSDYFTGKLNLDPEEMKRVNPFDWKQGFPDAMKAGGFDCIIGNPPYGTSLARQETDYVLAKYPYSKRFPDNYCLFVEKAMVLAKSGAVVSMIVPNTFCDLETCDAFRRWLLETTTLDFLWQSGWAFKEAVVDTLVFRITKTPPKSAYSITIVVGGRTYQRPCNSFLENDLHKIDYRNALENKRILGKLNSISVALGQIASIKAGVKMYEKGKGTPPQSDETMRRRPFSKDSPSQGWRPLYRGSDVTRYVLSEPAEFVNYGPWVAAPRSAELFESPKILMRRTDDRLMACIEADNAICVNSCHVIKLNPDSSLTYEYVLGLLNSRLLQRVFDFQNPQMVGKTFAEIKVIYVERLPIRLPDSKSREGEARYNRMVALVKQMLALNKSLASAKSRSVLQRQIDATDAEIDRLVYDLYGLTAEEIAIVEGGDEVTTPARTRTRKAK